MPARCLRGLTVLLIVFSPVRAQENSRNASSYAEKIKALVQQLRWRDEAGLERYESTKDRITSEILSDVDGFISDTFKPSSATLEFVRAGLNALLGYKSGDIWHNTAYAVDLAQGHFLIAGVELSGGSDAIDDDAISFRAYRQTGNKFLLTAHAEVIRAVADWHVKALAQTPVPNEFWFLVAADSTPQAPPTVAIRLCAFDGQQFHTVWQPKNIVAESAEKAVEVTDEGFIVDSLFDTTGGAASSPSVIIHERYVLTPELPQKTAEWRTDVQDR